MCLLWITKKLQLIEKYFSDTSTARLWSLLSVRKDSLVWNYRAIYSGYIGFCLISISLQTKKLQRFEIFIDSNFFGTHCIVTAHVYNGAKSLISIFSVISAPISKIFFFKRIYALRAIRFWHFCNVSGLAKRRITKTIYQNYTLNNFALT